MRFALSPDDRLTPPGDEERRSGLGGPLIYGLVVPFTLVVAGFAGWYMVTGETPTDIKDRLTHGPRIVLPMPARPGGDGPEQAMIRPPGAAPAPAAPKTALSPTQMPVAPQPTAPAPEEKHEETPAAAPRVTLPNAAPAPAPAPMQEKPAEKPTEKQAAPTPAAKPAGPSVSSFVAPPPPPLVEEPATPPGGESLAPPSFAQLPSPKEPAKPLGPAPTSDLLRASGTGSLPIRANGKEAWKAYGRPLTAAQAKPGAKIAIVVTGLGLSTEGTAAAISKLPGEISLSFSPYGNGLGAQIAKARENGHEALLDLPLEQANFPQHDPGPMAVLTSHSPGEAIEHLDVVLGKAGGYVGLLAPLGSPVTTTESWPLMLQELKDRGLLFVGDGLVGIEDKAMPAAGLATLVADAPAFRTAVDAKLARALAAAQRDGSAIIVISARPVSFERVLAFIASLPEKNVTLVPVSAIVHPDP